MKRQNPQRDLPTTNAHAMSRSGFLVAAILILISVSALGAFSAAAQSGRRSMKPTPSPTPTPTPDPTPTETKSTDKDKQLTLIVGMDSSDSVYIPRYLYDDVLQGCAQRLDQARSVKVGIERNMTRSDAIKRAKAETESPVVFLRLRADNISANSSGSADLSQLYIEYVIFAPATTKVLSAGNVYQGGINRGVITVPTSRGGTAGAELRLKQAAQDTADRILNALHIAPPHGPLF